MTACIVEIPPQLPVSVSTWTAANVLFSPFFLFLLFINIMCCFYYMTRFIPVWQNQKLSKLIIFLRKPHMLQNAEEYFFDWCDKYKTLTNIPKYALSHYEWVSLVFCVVLNTSEISWYLCGCGGWRDRDRYIHTCHRSNWTPVMKLAALLELFSVDHLCMYPCRENQSGPCQGRYQYRSCDINVLHELLKYPIPLSNEKSMFANCNSQFLINASFCFLQMSSKFKGGSTV